MKIREGYVSNSSSTSFLITNKTNEKRTLVDFVKENPHLIEEFVNYYDWHKGDPDYTYDSLLLSAAQENYVFEPNEEKVCTFGDHDGTVIGSVFRLYSQRCW